MPSYKQGMLHWQLPSAREFSHNCTLHLLAFSIWLLLSHQCTGSEKNFCQSLDLGRIATKRERATRLSPTRALAPLTCELWQDWCSLTFFDLRCHHCKGSKNYSHHSFSLNLSLSRPGSAEKLPIRPHTVRRRLYTDREEKPKKAYICIDLCLPALFVFGVLWEELQCSC
jgi:hypothetical protein